MVHWNWRIQMVGKWSWYAKKCKCSSTIWMFSTKTPWDETCFRVFRLFRSCLLSNLVIEWRRGWRQTLTEIYIINSFSLQIEYTSDPGQLEFLRLLSDRAKQRIKYNCKDSLAWSDQNDQSFNKSIIIKASNGIEMHAESSNKFKPKVILDGCAVRIISFFFLFYSCHSDH